MYHYEKDENTYRLVDNENGTTIYSGEKVAICFDRRDGTLLRHSDPVVVNGYFDRTTLAYCGGGLEDIAQDLVVVSSSEWPVEELNKCIEITGYVILMVQAYGISVSKPLGDLSDQPTVEVTKPHFNTDVRVFMLGE